MRRELLQTSKEVLANNPTFLKKTEQTDTNTRASEGHFGQTLMADTVSGASVM